jgi:hypothetical protein
MAIISGRISLKVDGEQMKAKGSFKVNPGRDKKEKVLGSDGVHGTKSMPQVPYIEGKVTDYGAGFDLEKLYNAEDVTATLELGNGKTFALYGGSYAAAGDYDSEEAELDFRIEGEFAEFI